MARGARENRVVQARRLVMGLILLVTGGLSAPSLEASERQRWEERRFEEKFWRDRERGWHWYEVMPVEEPPPEPDDVPPPMSGQASPQADAGPAPLSAQWLRETLPELRDAAINDPTENNVRAYFYAQRIMMDRAQIFSDVAQTVVRNDPLLDENLRLPFASAARAATLASAEESKQAIIESLADKAGLWVFYDETCEFCAKQLQPLNRFVDRHQMEMRVISRQGRRLAALNPRVKVLADTGQFANLGINFTPAVMLVVPPEGFYLISQGFIDYTSLVDRLVAAAHQYGLISSQTYFAARPAARGVLEASSIDETEQVDWNNTDSWVPFIQREIARVYGIEDRRK